MSKEEHIIGGHSPLHLKLVNILKKRFLLFLNQICTENGLALKKCPDPVPLASQLTALCDPSSGRFFKPLLAQLKTITAMRHKLFNDMGEYLPKKLLYQGSQFFSYHKLFL
jgi:hypothetical protein